MAIAVTKTTGEIAVGGGNLAYLMEVNADGSALGSPDTWHTMPHILESTVPIDTDAQKDIVMEDGGRVVLRSTRKVGAQFVFAQVSKAVLDIKEETRGKYYKLYYQDAPMSNNDVREYMFGVGQVFMNIEKKGADAQEQKVTLDFVCNKNAALIANTNLSLPSVKVTAGAMDVPANAYYLKVETAA